MTACLTPRFATSESWTLLILLTAPHLVSTCAALAEKHASGRMMPCQPEGHLSHVASAWLLHYDSLAAVKLVRGSPVGLQIL